MKQRQQHRGKYGKKKKLNLDSEGKKKVSKQLKRGQKGKYYEENV